MKNFISNFKITLSGLLVISFVLQVFSVRSQEIVFRELQKDTVVLITPRQLSTINSIIVDFENTKLSKRVLEELAEKQKESLTTQDSLINRQSVMIKEQNEKYQEDVSALHHKVLTEELENKRLKVISIVCLSGVLLLILTN